MLEKQATKTRLRDQGRSNAKFTFPKASQDSWRTGVFLHTRASGARIWIQKAIIEGRRREIELGEFPRMSMSEARKAADANKQTIGAGGDVLSKRRKDHEQRLRAQLDDLVARAAKQEPTLDIAHDNPVGPDHTPRTADTLNQRGPAVKTQLAQQVTRTPTTQPPYEASAQDRPKGKPRHKLAVGSAQQKTRLPVSSRTLPNTSLTGTSEKTGLPQQNEHTPPNSASITALLEVCGFQAMSPADQSRIKSMLVDLNATYGPTQMDVACAHAITHAPCSIDALEALLCASLKKSTTETRSKATAIAHANIRGPDYFH